MAKLLLSLHVLAAILTVGPVAVAASMFPRASPAALPTLYRICRVYAGIGVAVPVLGMATAGVMGVLGDAWVIASLVLTGAAAMVLVLLVLPGQQAAIDSGVPVERRLGLVTGAFNVLWAAVVVLMIVRPGSTTGA